MEEIPGRPGWREGETGPFDVCRTAVLLAVVLFILESSASHILVLLGYGDTRVTWVLWLRTLAVYLGAGLAVGAIPTLTCLKWRSERHHLLCRALIPVAFVGVYGAVLQQWRPQGWEWAPLVSPFVLVVIPLAAVISRHLTWPSTPTAPLRSIAFTTECFTWAPLLYLSLGPLVALHVAKGALSPRRSLGINLLVAGLCVVVAAVVAWQRTTSAPARPRSSPPPQHGPSQAFAMVALFYPALMFAAWQPHFIGSLGGNAESVREDPGGPLDLLLVIVDSLRADRLGAYGYQAARTPNLDAFAGRAIVYADHVSAAPWTYPSVASLLTGHSPTVHGARRLSWPRDPRQQPGIPELGMLRPDLPTIATELRRHGYDTAFIGSNVFLSRVNGLARGFDHYSDPLTSDFYATLGLVFSERDRWHRSVHAEEMTPRFLAWLSKKRGRPLALVAHYMDPHLPYAPPDRFRGRSRGDVSSSSAMYDGEISYVDEQFGRLWQYLHDTGRDRRTVVALTSDHGEVPDQRVRSLRWSPSADSFARGPRDHGHNVYQELLHVPFILYSPRTRPRVERKTTRAIDVLPTLFAALGLPVPRGLEGRSVLESVDLDLAALSESVLYGLEKKSWREGGYKLIHRSEYPEEHQFELYDLLADPLESRDLASREPRRVAAMARRLREYLHALHSAPAGGAAPIDQKTIEQLRSLGYVK